MGEGAVEVDEQTGGFAEETGGGQLLGEVPGGIGGAGIPAAMGAEHFLRGGIGEEVHPAFGHGICGVFAGDEEMGRGRLHGRTIWRMVAGAREQGKLEKSAAVQMGVSPFH